MDHVDRITTLVAATTRTACTYFSKSLVPKLGLLDGAEIIDLWTQFQSDISLRTQQPRRKPELKTPYGFYFYFYQTPNTDTPGRLVPMYVGKGPLPFRGLQHLGLQQYIDQVFTHAFGGAHSHPSLLSSEQLKVMQAALVPVRLGFILHSAPGLSDDAGKETVVPSAAELERRFQLALLPAMDGRLAPKTPPVGMIFDLKILAEHWCTAAKWATPPEVDTLIQEAQRCHERVLRTVPAPLLAAS